MGKTRYPIPSDKEEKQINAGIQNDPDSPEWDDEMFAKAQKGRGPQKAPTKGRLTVRLDEDIIDWLKSAGPGYQTRMNDLLRGVMEDTGR